MKIKKKFYSDNNLLLIKKIILIIIITYNLLYKNKNKKILFLSFLYLY